MASTTDDHRERVFHYAGSNFYVRPTYIVSIPQYVHSGPDKGKKHRNSLLNLADNRQQGNISQKAQSKIKNAVNWLIQSAKYKRVYDKKTNKNFYFKVNFVTLTIPLQENCPPDNFIKKHVFHAFIIYSRKYFGLRNYIWRAETQANGMLHFHLTTDTFMHWEKLRNAWNRILDKNGLLENHKAQHGNADPNSTDIHAVKSVRDLAAYLAKYFCKEDKDRRKVQGRLWGCNYELSHEKKCSVFCDPDESSKEHRALFNPEIRTKQIRGKEDFLGESKYMGDLYFLREKDWKLLKGKLVSDAYNNRRFQIRNNVAHLPEEYFTIN